MTVIYHRMVIVRLIYPKILIPSELPPTRTIASLILSLASRLNLWLSLTPAERYLEVSCLYAKWSAILRDLELKEQCGKLNHLSRHTTADKLYRISTLFSTISHENLIPEGILIHTIIHYIPALYRYFFVLYYCQKKIL